MRIVKTVLTVLTVLVTASLSYAQTLPQPQVQQDVLILDHNWKLYHRDVTFRGFQNSGTGTSISQPASPQDRNDPAGAVPSTNQGLSMPPPPRGPVLITEYVYTLNLKNVGAKTIKALGWDYIFMDPTTQQEMGRHHFQSAVDIGKHKQATVAHTTTSAPSKVVTYSALNQNSRQPFVELILITCIKYKDGSVWLVDSSRQKDCQAPAVRRH